MQTKAHTIQVCQVSIFHPGFKYCIFITILFSSEFSIATSFVENSIVGEAVECRPRSNVVICGVQIWLPLPLT
jgi:hypothetical protein